MSSDFIKFTDTPKINNKNNNYNYLKLIILILPFLILIFLKILIIFPKKVQKILFLTDLHYDLNYLSLGDPINHCHNINNNSNISFPYGQFGCDTPFKLFESILKGMKEKIPKPDLIIFGGDITCYINFLNLIELQKLFNFTYDLISKEFPNIPILNTLGNNDFVPNYGNLLVDEENFLNLIPTLSKFLTNNELITFKKGGYYYRDFNELKLRLIFLNSISLLKDRNYNDSIIDPFDQLKWFNEVSINATNKKFNIGIITHVPTGNTFWNGSKIWDQRFINKFYNTVLNNNIKFIISGHSHTDLILPIFRNNSKIPPIILTSPSISPSHKNNPGFRVYKIYNGIIQDFDQYIGDISKNPNNIEWKLSYTFTKEYNVKDVSFKNLQKVINKIQNNKEKIFK